MNEIILDEAAVRDGLFPFTLTRHVADIRVGILTIREKWKRRLAGVVVDTNGNRPGVAVIPANLLPNDALADDIKKSGVKSLSEAGLNSRSIQKPWDIFRLNDQEIRNDFELLTRGRTSAPLSLTNHIQGADQIFLEPGAKVEHAFLNALTGPIYIGKDAEIMEGAMVRGPFALCERGLVKMGSTIYGATTIGVQAIAGGEIKNSLLFDFANKSHHGYLGDSVIGAWCNLGAGSSNSNLMNTAGTVKVWDQTQLDFVPAGQKCGLFMGDYSRAAINTSFNTGTVIGTCCHIFGRGLTSKYIRSFSWGEVLRYEWPKLIEHLQAWKKLKNQALTEEEIIVLRTIFDQPK